MNNRDRGIALAARYLPPCQEMEIFSVAKQDLIKHTGDKPVENPTPLVFLLRG